jgi:hypothetical protein
VSVALLVALVLVPLANGGGPLSVRSLGVRPAVPQTTIRSHGATEWWQLLAFDPASRTTVRDVFLARPWANFRVTVVKRGEAAVVLAGDGWPSSPQSKPGVAMVGTSLRLASSRRGRASATRAEKYVVEARSGAGAAHLEIVPRRVGPTVGPWKLGRHQTSWNPAAFVPGTRTWSVPVAAAARRAGRGRRTPSGFPRLARVPRPHVGPVQSRRDQLGAQRLRGRQPRVRARRGSSTGSSRATVLQDGSRTTAVGRACSSTPSAVGSSRARPASTRSGWLRTTRAAVLPASRPGCKRPAPTEPRSRSGRTEASVRRRLSVIAQEVGGSKPTRGGTGWIAHATTHQSRTA